MTWKWPWQTGAVWGCDGCGQNVTGQQFKVGLKVLCANCHEQHERMERSQLTVSQVCRYLVECEPKARQWLTDNGFDSSDVAAGSDSQLNPLRHSIRQWLDGNSQS